MARGPKKHLKRLNAPNNWMLHKMGGTWAPRPNTGPHKLRESFPLALILRNRLKYALTRREVIMCVMRRTIEVDGKVRTDTNYPAGFQDVISIPKTDEHFRILYDTKGHFILHRIHVDESKYKLLRVTKLSRANKASIGRNPFLTGHAAVIPFIVTHDGRTIRYADPVIRVGDTIKFETKTGKIAGHIKLDIGNLAMITKGANIGRVGVITRKERHEGSFDIIHLKDKKGATFATRAGGVFVIGDANNSWITLPRGKGLKLSIMEEREKKTKDTKKN
jgi:small subunit ribosomal protein S4e